MAEFLPAYEIGRQNEGGYVNDPSDKGGETYAGVARNYWPSWKGWPIIDASKPLKRGDFIKNEELESCIKQFYRQNFWNKIQGDYIDSQAVATFIYDWTLTSGKAIKIIQRELGLTDDGIFGNGTLAAVNNAGDDFLSRLHKMRDAYYHFLVNRDATLQKFLLGWVRRNDELFNKLK